MLLLVLGILLLGTSWAVQAAPPPAVNPQAGSIGLSGVMPGPAPTVGANILIPRNGQHLSTSPTTVSGTCPAGTFVSINKNNVFGGATTCQDNGTFSLLVDLFDGANALVAQDSDALGQNGPPSATVNVTYDAPSLALPSGSASQQLFLTADASVVAGNPDQPISRSITIVGGIGPYAVNWDFGDGETSLVSRTAEGPVTATHTYKRAGTYRVIVRATDSTGNTAFIQVLTIVNGPVTTYGGAKNNGLSDLPGTLMAIWPLYALMAITVASFFFGERAEDHKLRRQHRLLQFAQE